jgi:hypothetical protein
MAARWQTRRTIHAVRSTAPLPSLPAPADPVQTDDYSYSYRASCPLSICLSASLAACLCLPGSVSLNDSLSL